MPIDAIVEEESATVDTIVPAPEGIKTLSKAEDVLRRIRRHEELTGCKAVILLVQNWQLGEIYRITSKYKARSRLSRQKDVGEIGIEIYSKAQYERRAEELRRGSNGGYQVVER